MSVSGVNFSGLSSGLDTASIISKYVQIASQPVTIYQNQQKTLLNKETAYKTVSAKLIALQGASQTLNRLRAFNVVTTATSDTTVATGSAATGTQAGQYNLVVNNLATAQTLSSAVQTSQTAALGFDGQIVINGKAVTVHASDSLQGLASDINGAQTGVTASIVQPTPGQFYLSLGSSHTGVEGAISLSDTGNGSLLKSLGFFDASGATTLKNPVGTTGAASNLFSDSSTSVGTLLGLTNPAAGTLVLGGQAVNIDLGRDSLSAVANKITAAGIPGISAKVIATTDPITNAAKQQLQISGTQSFTDTNGVLSNLGIVQSQIGAGRQTIAAQDASFTINGLAATRASNSFSDVVSGLTINLVKAGSATLTVASDTKTLKSEINDYVAAFNDVVSTITTNSQYDSTTNTAGTLLGDGTTQSIVDSLTQGVTDRIANLSSSTNSLAQIGISLGTDGTLSVDDSKLSAALVSDPAAVGRVFRADGVTNNGGVTFVSTNANTKPSPLAGYGIQITQAAAQATYTAGTAQTGPLAQDETLTFGGGLFGTTDTNPLIGGHTVKLSAGSSLQDVVNTINGDSIVNAQLTASIVNGKLTLTSKSYGSATQFYVGSGVADQKDGLSTGIGTAAQKAVGVDVAGTINGEAATGAGQYLIGSQAYDTSKAYSATNRNGQALGLQLLITATAPGSYGNVVISKGAASFADSFITSETDAYTGALTDAASTAHKQYDDLTQTITDLKARVADYQKNLQAQFNNLEKVVGQLKATGSSLTSLAASSSSSSSSNK